MRSNSSSGRIGAAALLLFLASHAACGLSTDWGWTAVKNAPNGSISSNPTEGDFFDVWTFKVMAAPLSCPAIQTGLSGTVEQYRIVETSQGCAVSEKAADGTQLTESGKLFDPLSDCLVDIDSITLERKFKVSTELGLGCTNSAEYIARLEKGVDSTTITGEITGYITYSGNCIDNGQPAKDCDFRAPLVGTRGRTAQ
ncbi:MAG: hypothetical protein WC956_06380 [bacterium]